MTKKAMPKKAQEAAVRSLMHDEGKKLTWIKKRHPELSEGIAAVETALAAESTPRGSGSVRPVQLPTMSKGR